MLRFVISKLHLQVGYELSFFHSCIGGLSSIHVKLELPSTVHNYGFISYSGWPQTYGILNLFILEAVDRHFFRTHWIKLVSKLPADFLHIVCIRLRLTG